MEMRTRVLSAHARDVTLAHQVLDTAAAVLILSGSFGEERVLPALHFFRRYILDVRGNAPLLAERVGNLSVAVAPEHILQWHIDSRTCRNRAVKNLVGVRDVQMDIHGVSDPLAGAGYRR